MSQAGLAKITDQNIPGDVPTSFVTNSGTAVPIGHVIDILGGTNATTSASGNVITITVTGGGTLTTLTGNSGGPISPSGSNINTIGSGSITIAGSGSTLTTQLTGLTNHSVQVGAGTATLTQLAVGNNGQVLIGATGADPAFSTLTSSDGSIAFTSGAHSLSLQVNGALFGQTITGNTGGALSPTAGNWNIVGTGSTTASGSGSTLTVQLTGLTNHSVLVGAGTATVTKVGPSATSGQIFQSAGSSSDPVFSTATYPSTATGTGTILRADGTNWVATTTTYPNTNAVNTLLYASSANVMSALATANNGVLATDGSGVPSITATPTVTSITFGSGSALNTYVGATSWTPNIQINGSNTGITYTTQTGYYSQIGNIVFINFTITLSSKGASTGSVSISNLPVATGSHGSNNVFAIAYFNGFTLANYTSLGIYFGNSSSVVNFVASGQGQGATTVTNAQIGNTFQVLGSGFYIIS